MRREGGWGEHTLHADASPVYFLPEITSGSLYWMDPAQSLKTRDMSVRNLLIHPTAQNKVEKVKFVLEKEKDGVLWTTELQVRTKIYSSLNTSAINGF